MFYVVNLHLLEGYRPAIDGIALLVIHLIENTWSSRTSPSSKFQISALSAWL